jgi:hypothetical protein
VVLNPIPQHDPHPDSQLASHRGSRLSETSLDQFAAVKMFQLWIPAYRIDRCFTSQKSQQGIALFGQATQPLSLPTGILPWDHPYITGQLLAVCESRRIAQEHLGR